MSCDKAEVETGSGACRAVDEGRGRQPGVDHVGLLVRQRWTGWSM